MSVIDKRSVESLLFGVDMMRAEVTKVLRVVLARTVADIYVRGQDRENATIEEDAISDDKCL